jgi:hypothetical protein
VLVAIIPPCILNRYLGKFVPALALISEKNAENLNKTGVLFKNSKMFAKKVKKLNHPGETTAK